MNQQKDGKLRIGCRIGLAFYWRVVLRHNRSPSYNTGTENPVVTEHKPPKVDNQVNPKWRHSGHPGFPDYLIATVSGGGVSSVPGLPAFNGMQNNLQTSSPPGFSPLISVRE